MAQQTINVGTAPNDGTGTPLRTAFQYTNSNFSELYTAVGPSGNNIVVPGSATITGDLTVATNRLSVSSTGVQIGTTTNKTTAFTGNGTGLTIGAALAPTIALWDTTNASYVGSISQIDADMYLTNTAVGQMVFSTDNTSRYTISSTGVATWSNVGGVAGTAMTLNSTGLGVGVSPTTKLDVLGSGDGELRLRAGSDAALIFSETAANKNWKLKPSGGDFQFQYSATAYNSGYSPLMYLTATGNVGIGVTPSAKLHVSDANLYAPSLTWNTSCANIVRSENGQLATGSDSSGPYAFWMQVRTIGNSARDISLNPLGGNVIIGSRTANNGKLTVTETANSDAVQLIGSSGLFARFYGWSVDNTWNANATAIFVGKQTSTSRSINAGGTVNASGADYAEYMTKAGDFVLAKGDIAGVDANGKLTNVFADAVSFVVKSTDPSYVGNDKWGVGLEGDSLESARQLVDRIAFAGQVPVNVIGAKAGDYIVPVVDGTGIKGIAVSNPTFEQYQLAVGKVIAIDADGRARIIVKVA